ncbi:Pectate lyase, N-terminal [Sesbania bispinosa]|nr:Pectate lyase, N-terminal [Sesbania bispinosa]
MTGIKVTFIILLVAFAITIPRLEAGIAEFDDFLKAQADEAHEIALKSYVPNPENMKDELNVNVHLGEPETHVDEKQDHDKVTNA